MSKRWGCERVAEGYVKLYRKLKEWKWYDDPNTKTLFLHCLISANYEDSEWHNIEIPKGSFITSIGNLAVELGLSPQQVRTSLNKLKSTNEITSISTNKYTVINVENWAKYQVNEVAINKQNNKQDNKRITNEQQTNNKQITTVKELKEIKNLKEEKEVLKDIVTLTSPTTTETTALKTFVRPSLSEVKAYCFERNNNVNAEKWFNFYESNGWKVGKNSMKNWKAAVRTWEHEDGRTSNVTKPSLEEEINARVERARKNMGISNDDTRNSFN